MYYPLVHESTTVYIDQSISSDESLLIHSTLFKQSTVSKEMYDRQGCINSGIDIVVDNDDIFSMATVM